jgi:hypothetical protein
MLEDFVQSDFERLLASTGGAHVSIFMPTRREANYRAEDILRLKHLLQQAEKELASGWLRSTEVPSFLAPISSLLTDESFWSGRQEGLAIFLSPSEMHTFRFDNPVEERLEISRGFVVRPLMVAMSEPLKALVLSLSENKIQLYSLDEHSIEVVAVPDLPESMEVALNYTAVDRGQQVHTGSVVRGRKGSGVFHGQGGVADTHKDDLQAFFRLVDEALTKRIHGTGRPLIVACVEASFPIYRQVSSHGECDLLHLAGNFDYAKPEDLRRKAWPMLKEWQDTTRHATADRLRKNLDTGLASDRVGVILPAAFAGRIDTLFYARDAVLLGQFDPLQQTVVVFERKPVDFTPYNSDLIETAIQQVLAHRGRVYAAATEDLPGGGPFAALFRY